MKIISIITAAIMMMTMLVSCGYGKMSDQSTVDFVNSMGVGINLGNTFDCSGEWFARTVEAQETAWGSPIITKQIIQGYADAGFGAMRLPVSWTVLMDDDGNINKDFMNRIEEVVGWILDSGMVCIMNSHHDSWGDRFGEDYDAAMQLYSGMWEQICKRFKKYGENLMFESMNEVGIDGIWDRFGGTTDGKDRAYEIVNNINQQFVDIVRASGGNNEKRHLLIASYWTDIDLACDELFKMPYDPAGKCAVSVHYYTPATLCLISEDVSWGKATTEWGSEADYQQLNGLFDKMKEHYTDKGIPVIVGEYGCLGDNKPREVIERWTLDVASAACERGFCPVLWDTPGGEYDRANALFKYPEFIAKLTSIK